jgi:UDP-glucose 4-epimerase
MRVLVTGGAGHVGSHLVDLLCDEGHDVVVLDDLSTGRAENLAGRASSIRLVNGSILDRALVRQCVQDVDLVFHLAAAVGVRHIVDRPLESILVNVQGSENVFDACATHGRKVLLASSSEVYGKTATIPMREDDDRVLGSTSVHRWSYSTAKALDEHLAFAHAQRGLPVVVVRYFNSFGPRIDPRGYGSVMAHFIRQALAGEPITVHGDGAQSRTFTFVTDMVRGTYLAATTPAAEGMAFNLGGRVETSIAELAEMVRTATQSRSEIVSIPYAATYGEGFEDTRRRVPDISRAEAVLGWSPQISLADGIERTLHWWRSSRAA